MAGKSRPTFIAVIQSILAAAFGVQSNRKREQDFQKGRASDFIIAGALFTVILVLSLLTLANSIAS